MKATLKITKLELNILFYSPIAWFLSVVFIFQCGLFYTTAVDTKLIYQNIGGEMLNNLGYLTSGIFGTQSGLFGDVLKKVYLYLPLLTMGLISREVNSGTIKLLYSSPIKISQIIWGKFIAMVVYNLLLIAILVMFAVTAILNIKSADAGLIFAGITGIFLLLCAYAAIGLFMSCLTAYQIVAAISTLVVFAALAYVGSVWQDSGLFRNISYYLSMNGRAEKIIYGLLNTRDILYFIIIICLFIGFSIIKLRSSRESKSVYFVTGQYITLIIIALVTGYLSSLPGLIGYYDTTVDESQTLHPNTQKVLKELGDAPLEVTSYINLLDQKFGFGRPAFRNHDKERWESYLRFKNNIKFNYVYYYDMPGAEQNLFKYHPGKNLQQLAREYAKSWKIDLADIKTPEDIKKIIDLQPEHNRYVMQLKYKNRTTFLRLFDDQIMFPTETETCAALKRLTVKLPKILFATGEFERSINKFGDKDYGTFVTQIVNRFSMVNQGFDTDTISLNTQDIPAGISALVIADPKIAFTAVALAKIDRYIKNGGNLLIAGEPGKQTVINPVIQSLGVSMMDGLIVQKNKDFAPDVVKAFITAEAANLSPDVKYDFDNQVKLDMPGVAGLIYQKTSTYKIKPLFITDTKDTWLRKSMFIPDSTELVFSVANGDQKTPLATMLSLQRNINDREQRIVISGDADFLSSANVKSWGPANRELYMPLMGWFTYGQFPIDTSRPRSKDNRFDLTDAGLTKLKIFYLGIIPGITLIMGSVFLIRRKRR